MSIVVDASTAIAWLFAAERSDMTRAALRKVAAEGGVVPSIWRLEVANVLRTAVRRNRCSADYADNSLKRLIRLRVSVDPFTDERAWGETRRLALLHELTLYDAAYLELAARNGVPLATLDEALVQAAKRDSVAVFASN
jgi:predicted nucleic acid-binding protein